jgi:hypothetical protein
MVIDAIVAVSIAITTILGAVFTLFKFLQPLTKALSQISERLDKFFRDWDGTPAEPGRDEVPGVMERLNKLDGELSRNGGKSVKDVVNRIEKRLEEGDKNFNEFGKRITAIESSLNSSFNNKKDVA